MSRRRISVMVLVAVALAGLAAGLLVARGSEAASKQRAGVLASGRFTAGEWSTKGQALIVRKGDGSVKLQLKNFSTQAAPELYVVLESPAGVQQEIDELQSAAGSQTYSLPKDAAASLPRKVIIFCAKCGKTWGSAVLRSTST